MNHPRAHPLVVEVRYFHKEVEVVNQPRAAGSNTLCVLVVDQGLSGRQDVVPVLGELVKFATFSTMELLVMDRYGVDFSTISLSS